MKERQEEETLRDEVLPGDALAAADADLGPVILSVTNTDFVVLDFDPLPGQQDDSFENVTTYSQTLRGLDGSRRRIATQNSADQLYIAKLAYKEPGVAGETDIPLPKDITYLRIRLKKR